MTLEKVESAAVARTEELRAANLQRPTIGVLDEWDNFRGYVTGELSGDAEELLNDTGESKLVLPWDDALAQWSVKELPIEATPTVWVQQGMWRWAGKIDSVDFDFSGDFPEVVWTILHTYEEMKHITCWANPIAPIGVQWPKACVLAGPSAWVVRTFLFLNLMRLQTSIWTFPDNIFDLDAWRQRFEGAEPDKWGIFVMPGPAFGDDPSPWTILTSRFAMFHDLVEDTLASGQLKLATSLWLPGDPQPAPHVATLTKPTVVVDVVWQGGADDVALAQNGGAWRVWMNRVTEGVEDLVEEIVAPDGPDLGNSEAGNVLPLCIYRANEHEPAVPGTGLKIVKPKAYQVVHGGKSPGWVNSSLKLGLNALLGWLGAIIGNPGLALGIFDEQVEDVFLAFGYGRSERRRDAMGRRPYHEHWETGGEVGMSVSGLQAQRAGMHATRGYLSYRAQIPGGGPFGIGRHYVVGDRLGFEILDTFWVSRVHAYRIAWDRDTDPVPDVSIGDDGLSEQPSAQLAKKMEKVGSAIQALGVGG